RAVVARDRGGAEDPARHGGIADPPRARAVPVTDQATQGDHPARGPTMRALRAKLFGRRPKSRPGDDWRRGLEAAARELPSPEVTRRMAEGLGLTTATVAAAAAYAAAEAKAAGLAASGASTLVLPALTVGVVAVTVASAVVGVGSG